MGWLRQVGRAIWMDPSDPYNPLGKRKEDGVWEMQEGL